MENEDKLLATIPLSCTEWMEYWHLGGYVFCEWDSDRLEVTRHQTTEEVK